MTTPTSPIQSIDELREKLNSIRLHKKQYFPFKEAPNIKGLSTLVYYDADLIDGFLDKFTTSALLEYFESLIGEDEPSIINTTPDMKTGRYNVGSVERNQLRAEIRATIRELKDG